MSNKEIIKKLEFLENKVKDLQKILRKIRVLKLSDDVYAYLSEINYKWVIQSGNMFLNRSYKWEIKNLSVDVMSADQNFYFSSIDDVFKFWNEFAVTKRKGDWWIAVSKDVTRKRISKVIHGYGYFDAKDNEIVVPGTNGQCKFKILETKSKE